MAGFLELRDEVGVVRADHPAAHGTGFDRIGAFVEGYEHGASRCAAYPDEFAAGDHVVVGENVYGGSHRLMEWVYRDFGLSFSFVDARDPAEVEAAIRPETRMLYGETPTNPMMFLADLQALGDIAQARGLLFVVDNTFATPVLQRPLAFGADIVLHSTTKYLNGHSDMVGGALVVGRDDLAERIGFLQNAAGGIPGPFDCWLALRGIKTLGVRMERHESNGRALASFLADHPKVASVLYPGLPHHPGHAVQKRQASGFGALITFDLGSFDAAKRYLDRLEVMSLAESLGGVETLTSHPASMTHASVPPAKRAELGITDGLVRISAGIDGEGVLVSAAGEYHRGTGAPQSGCANSLVFNADFRRITCGGLIAGLFQISGRIGECSSNCPPGTARDDSAQTYANTPVVIAVIPGIRATSRPDRVNWWTPW